MPTLTFRPSNTSVPCHSGQSIFELGWKEDVGLQSACVGKGTCGLCRVVIVEGEENLSPYSEVEDKHLGNLYHLTKRRLSCQAIVQGGDEDIVVEVAPKKKRRSRDR